MRDGVAWGRLAPLRVFDDPAAWFERGGTQDARLGEFDVILMRKDPPFDIGIRLHHLCSGPRRAAGRPGVQSPAGPARHEREGLHGLFPECCAPTLITRDMHDMSDFLREHGRAVCKPLHGMGGKSIFVLEQGDKNRNVVFETLTDYGTRYAIVQRYLPEIVTEGDCASFWWTENRRPLP